MRKTLTAVAVTLALVGIGLLSTPLAARAPQHIVIRVTSVDQAHAAKFRAALVVDGSPLRTFSGETPFETTTTGPLALGIFESEGDGSNFKVEVFVEGAAEGKRAGGPGPRIIVGSDVVDRGVMFARIY
jgi:hypothetical protein